MIQKPDSYVPDADVIRRAFEGSEADDLTFVARWCLELGAWDHVLAISEAFGPSSSVGLRLSEAVARFVAGDAARAWAIVDGILQVQPNQLSAQAVRAQMLARSGDIAGAKRQLLSVVDRYPDYPGAQALLATLMMPGPYYRDVLARIHERLEPRCYLEIGVDTGATLALARHSQVVIGVDPAERALVAGVPKCARLFREESDLFFRTRTREQLLGEKRIDLGFIDGLHLFENALADFANLERWAHASATIVLHDCVPLAPCTASRERRSKFWVGDTWKVVPTLVRFRPDLRIRTILAPPSGLVVIRRLNPGSTLLRDRFEEIVTTLKDAEWTHEPGAFPTELNVVSNDERGIDDAFGPSR